MKKNGFATLFSFSSSRTFSDTIDFPFIGANSEYDEEILLGSFPQDFMWGAATAAYQVLGH